MTRGRLPLLAISILLLGALLAAGAGRAPAQAQTPHPHRSGQEAAGPPGPSAFAVGEAMTSSAQSMADLAAATGADPAAVVGPDRYATSAAVAAVTHPDGAESVVVASGETFPDALSAGSLVADREVPLLLTEADVLPDAVAAELVRLAPDEVVVLGGPAAVGDPVVGRIRQLTGVAPERVAGENRYATAAAVADVTHPEGAERVFLASGDGWADAVAAAPAVDAGDGALLLTRPDELPVETADAIRRLAPREVWVLGGTAAVGAGVDADVDALVDGGRHRLAGADRYGTAAAINDWAHPGGTSTVVAATGLDWADALVAAPLVAARDAELRLVDTRVRWTPDISAAVAAGAARDGDVTIQVRGTRGHVVADRPDTPVAAASTLKVMFMLVHLRHPSVRDRPLTQDDLDLLEPMITRSANWPGTVIADRYGAGAMIELATQAGMQDFAWTRPWGNTRTSARDQERLMSQLERLLPDRHRDYALDLLTRVVPEQRWGLMALDLPDGWVAHVKGGWGSGTGAVDHQVALLRHDSGAYASVAVMVTGSPSHAYGKATLEEVFAALLADLPA